MDDTVYVVRCADYQEAEKGIQELFAMMGGMEHFAVQGERIDHRGCIRCCCCHEMCPENAIELRQGLSYRIANA